MSFLTENFLEGMRQEKEKEIFDLLIKEFKEMFPSRCRVLGEKNLNLFAQHCQARAVHYKYEQYVDLKRYAIVAFFLGTYFEEDTLYPWVETIFQKRKSFSFQAEELLDTFVEMHDEIVGEKLEHFEQTLKRLQQITPQEIESLKTYPEIVNLLKRVYPKRLEVLDEVALKKLFMGREEQIKKYNISTKLGVFTYCSAMIFLGSHAERDPLYAWVQKYLEKPNPNAYAKSLALFNKAKSRIRRELRELEKMKEEA